MHIVDPGDPLDTDHPFMARLVRQPRGADEIADGIDPGLAGAQPFIDDDVRFLDRDTGVFEADVLDIADDADREDDALDLQLAPLPSPFDTGGDTLVGALECRDRRSGVNPEPLLFERLASERRDLLV